MAQPTFVSGIAVEGAATSATIPATLNWAQTAGNTLVVGVFWRDNTRTISSIADTAGNTYTLKVGPTTRATGNTLTVAMYVCAGIKRQASSANTITVTFSASTTVQPCIAVVEYTGTTGATDGTGTGATGSSTAPTTTGPTTTNAVDTLIAFCGHWATSTESAGTNYTNRLQSTNSLVTMSDRAVVATGTYAGPATLGSTVAWGIQVLAIHSGNPQVTNDIASHAALVATARFARILASAIASGTTIGATARVNCNATCTIVQGITIAPPGPRGITVTALSRLARALGATITRSVALVNTAKVTHNAGCAITPGIAVVASTSVERRTSSTIAALVVLVAPGIKNIPSQAATLLTGATIGCTANVIHNASTSIVAGHAITQRTSISCGTAITATAKATLNAGGAIASGAVLVGSLNELRRATSTLAAVASLLGTARRILSDGSTVAGGSAITVVGVVTHNAHAGLTSSVALVNTAKGVHIAAAVLTRVISLLATPNVTTSGPGVGNVVARATIGAIGKVTHSANAGLVGSATTTQAPTLLYGGHVVVAVSSSLLQTSSVNATVSILGALRGLLVANQIKSSPLTSTCSIHVGLSASKNAAFVTHKASTQIFAGRKPVNAASIISGAHLICVANNKMSSGRVGILSGLTTNARTQANVVLIRQIVATGSVRLQMATAINALFTVGATGTVTHFQCQLLPRITMTCVGSVISASIVDRISVGASIGAVGILISTGPGRCSIGTRATIGVTGSVRRGATTTIQGRGNVLAQLRTLFRGVGQCLPRIDVSANGIQSHSFAISNVAVRTTMLAQINILFRSSAGISSKISIVGQAGAPRIGTCVLAIGGRLAASVTTSKVGSAAIAGRTGVTANSRSIKSVGDVIHAGAVVSPVGKVNHFAALSILSGLRILVTAFNSTTASSVSIHTGATIGVVGTVKHSAALYVQSGVTVVGSNVISRRSRVVINPRMGMSLVSRTSYGGTLLIGTGVTMLLGQDHHSLAISSLTLGRTLGCQASLKSNATVGIRSSGGMGNQAKVDHFAALHVVVGALLTVSNNKGIPLSAAVRSGVQIVGNGEANFFGGSHSNVQGQVLVGTVINTTTKSVVTQIS